MKLDLLISRLLSKLFSTPSMGLGGGVVASVYPIHASIAKTPAIAINAVIRNAIIKILRKEEYPSIRYYDENGRNEN